MTMSASTQTSSMACCDEAIVSSAPRKWWSTSRRRSRFLSRTKTSECKPTAMVAAAKPDTPAPRITTRAQRTPGTPLTSTPLPPPGRIRWCAPISGAMRPATSLMGASRGSELSCWRTVS